MAAPRGYVTIRTEECKGCGLCLDACPPKCLVLSAGLSAYGVHPATYTGTGCTACSICFYACPEPGAITVFRLEPPARAEAVPAEETSYAAAL